MPVKNYNSVSVNPSMHHIPFMDEWLNKIKNDIFGIKYPADDYCNENEIREKYYNLVKCEEGYLGNRDLLLLHRSLLAYAEIYEEYLYNTFNAFWDEYCKKTGHVRISEEEKLDFMASIYDPSIQNIDNTFQIYRMVFKLSDSKDYRNLVLKVAEELKDNHYALYAEIKDKFKPLIILFELSYGVIEEKARRLSRNSLLLANKNPEDYGKIKLAIGLIEYIKIYENKLYIFRDKGWQNWACEIALLKPAAFSRWKNRNRDSVKEIIFEFTEKDFYIFYKRWKNTRHNLNLKPFHKN